jgi:predicted flap endonuclease-1-like 5' DNA nuclease
MSGLFWLISEMLLLLTLAAIVFFSFGWRWQAKRARAQTLALEVRLDEEAQAAKIAREERDAARHAATTAAPQTPDPDLDIAALAAELNETQAHQLSLERELLRLRDAKLALERELEAARTTPPVATSQVSTSPPDDLTRLRGVGAVMSKKLHAAGITTFHQLATLSADELSTLDRTLKLQGRASRERWQEQARVLHAETHGSPA